MISLSTGGSGSKVSADGVSSGYVLGANALSRDAWGKQKVTQDYSMFSGLFTYDVPDIMWKEYTNGTELLATNVNATSVDGALQLTSTTGNTATLRSKRHPRYQSNRGQLYSTACWFPTPGESGTIREWGLNGDDTCGAFFRLTDEGIYAVRIRQGVEVLAELVELPEGFDVTKGHLYDIQYQWRGVGDYFFFIDQTLVYTDTNLGLVGESSLPTICNPALPIYWHVEGDAKVRAGCVDVTSEGGVLPSLQYRSVSTPVDITSTEVSNTNSDGEAILAIHAPSLFKSKYNTRDSVLNRITTFCKDEAVTAVWLTRDPTVIGGIADNANPLLGWASIVSDSPLKYMLGGHDTLLETTFESNHTSSNTMLLVTRRQEIDQPNILDNAHPDRAPFYFTNGDYLIVTMRPDGTAKDSGCSIELSEEI